MAGELAADPDCPDRAFAKYDAKLRDYVGKAQNIPLGGLAPRLLNPKAVWGIKLLRFVFWLVAWTGVWKMLSLGGEKAFTLPNYDF